MRKLKRKMRNLVVIIGLVLSIVAVKTAFAAFSGPDAKGHSVYSESTTESDQLTLGYFSKPKARAPEPSSLALFGSGLLGMILSFIRSTYIMAKRAFDIAISIVAFIVL